MTETRRSVALALGLGLVATTAFGQSADKVRIGLIQTLSGPAAALGQQVRDGFNLAVKELGGKLGGRDVEVIVVDDELKPDVAVTKVKGLLDRDKVDFVVGPIFSNMLMAIHKPVARRRRVPDQPERRPVELRRQGVQPELLRHLLPERPGHEVLGKVRAGQRLQAGLSPGAELPGRQGLARRASSATSRARSWRRSTSR